MSRKFWKKAALGGLAAFAALAMAQVPAQAQGSGPIRIGVLNDQGGPYSAITGPGSVAAARMAVQDLGGTVLGRPVEVLSADHQHKPDLGFVAGARVV